MGARFCDTRREAFGVVVVALGLLLFLYLELYRWEGVHVAVTAYEPNPPYMDVNLLSSGGAEVRQRLQQIVEGSQQKMLKGGGHVSQKCPAWYDAIREDFKPWSDRQGITPAALGNAWPLAHFRFQIVDGDLYVERNWQTMDFKYMEYLRFYYTVWGILQLLRRYPGQIPDVDVMMETFDQPLVDRYQWEMDLDPPPLLKYCSTANNWDIAWPDWTFWGWAELDIPPWQLQLDAIVQTNKTAWEKRPGHAFWQGGSERCPARQELWKCEDNEKLRWGVELRHVQWESGITVDHKLLENQCQHKFKLYMEGWAWSASAKYILACDATTLMVESEWYEFWYRGLKPGVNFLPVPRTPNLCAKIRRAVDWARAHPKVAKKIGQEGTDFLTREVNMPLVYDYMLHVLKEYAGLQTFKVQPSEYALKVDAKTWLEHAFDERNLDAKLPPGLREWPVQDPPRYGIPSERVRAQLLVEEPAQGPPCTVDWNKAERPFLNPEDTVGSIPMGLRKEFTELAAWEAEREESGEAPGDDREAQELRQRAAIADVLRRSPGPGGGLESGVGKEKGVGQSIGGEGPLLLGQEILGDMLRGGGKVETENESGGINLVGQPDVESRKRAEVKTSASGGVADGGEKFDERLRKKFASKRRHGVKAKP